MKKKSIFISILTLVLCVTMLTGIVAPKKKPIIANEMAKAEEVIEYTYEDENDSNIVSDDQENLLNDTISDQNIDDCHTCICVIGKAKLTLSPDMATITACIEKFNEDINISKNETLEILNNVINALKSQGVAQEKISLDYFNAGPSYDFSVGHQPIGFYSKSCFSFEVDNLEDIPNYISTLTENGVTNICDICYSLSNIEEEYNNALIQALDNAKAKASAIFKNDNLKICGIREEYVYSANTLCRKYVEDISSSLIGKVEIEACVNVEFKEG